jgi:tRNA(adenine34) deaminase
MINETEKIENENHMNEALKMARIGFENGEVPVGCVIVYKNEIIGKGHNKTIFLIT